ncbi:class I SAM-dependent methyltransferase [Ruegeria sp. HKCCD7255]|nr:methyltransferase domain-containing protein [Ruegeria sp. HKCCD7255]
MRSPSSSQSPAQLDRKYDAAAAGWSDKMRLLGYFDAYLGFLSSDPSAPLGQNALDIGCGTGAFAEARAVIHSSGRISLLEPSAAMLTQAQKSLSARGASAEAIPERLED